MPEVRAQVIVSMKDQLSDPMKKAGANTKGALTDINKGASDVIQKFTGLNIGSLGAAAAIGGLAAVLGHAISQAAEAEKIMAVTEAVVKSTGMAAGLTADQIANMSGRLSQLNAVDDEVIQSGANLLLTFKKVKSDAFEPAMQAALDMSVVMGTDLRGSVMMVGKALEDPVRGITALRRAGVSFTAEQQAVIKSLVETGRAAEAQQMILAELNSQVGGAGAAAAQTYAGQVSLLKINIDNLAQSIGEKLLPTLTKATTALNLLITWNDKVEAALVEHEAAVLDTAGSYEEYRTEVIRARLASGLYAEQLTMAQKASGMMTAETGLMMEAVFASRNETNEAERATARMAATAADAATNTDALGKAGDAAAIAAKYQAQAEDDLAAALENAEREARDLELANRALAAGLAGTLTQAHEDYLAVLDETQPQIETLTADLARYNAAHGQSFTVVNEAKHSVEQYELAQIKAAAAAQELAEFNGDNREEFLNLKIAADEAAERVANMGTEMGISTTFTADYTRKIQETTGDLDALKLKQAEAEAQLKLTTAQFLYQQIAADLDAEAALGLARELGLIDEATYTAATAAQTLAQAYRDNKLDVDNLIGATGVLRDTINSLQSRNIEITISTIYHEFYVQSGLRPEHEGDTGAGGEGGYVPPAELPPDPERDRRAHGGSFIVPPGYPNDSYMMGVQSGERVSVTPAGGDPVADLILMLPGMLQRAMSSALAQQGGIR